MVKLISKKEEIVRVPTNIQNFDEALEGGLPENFVVLVAGTSGTMKSSLCFNTAYHEIIKNNANAVYITLEQSTYSLLNQMITMNFDLSKINLVKISEISKIDENIKNIDSKKNFIVVDVGVLRKEVEKLQKVNTTSDWIYVIKNIITKLKQNSLCDIVILDSLSALYVLSEFKENPRMRLFEFFEFLRDNEITSLLISEIPADSSAIGEFGIEDYLADGVILLAKQRSGLSVRRELSVAKMRETNANMDIFVLEFDGGKFRALTKIIE